MGDINLNTRSYFPFTSGDVPEGEDVSQLLYYPDATPASLEVINGHLSRANFDSSALPLDKELLRKGALSSGKQVGATLNTDFPSSIFEGLYNFDQLLDDDLFDADAKAALAIRFYLPEAVSAVQLFWRMGFVLDTGYEEPTDFSFELIDDFEGRARLFYDGAAVRAVTRDIKSARRMTINDTPGLAVDRRGDGAPDTRWWSGSFIVDDNFSGASPLARGWHTASIRVATVYKEKTEHNNCLLRVRARFMGYTVLK